MGPVKPEVGTDEVRIGIVLNVCIKEGAGRKSINQFCADEIGCKRSVWKRHTIPVVGQIQAQVVIRSEGKPGGHVFDSAVVEVAPVECSIAADFLPYIGREISCV